MKNSASKKQLAKIISENGGWRDGEFAAQDGDGTGSVDFFKSKPQYYPDSKFWRGVYDPSERIERSDVTIKNFHQTILSRAEYFRLYPAPDADGWIEWEGGECPVGDDALVEIKTRDGETQIDQAHHWNWSHERGSPVQDRQIIAYRLHNQDQVKPEFCESVMRSIPEPSDKPTIEQLATEYRNRQDYAERKQQEADEAKAEAEAKLAELVAAGKAVGLVVSVAEPEPEPELVITDWRDLQVGDIVWVDAYDTHPEGEWPVNQMEDASYTCDYAFAVKTGVSCERWVDVTEPWKFIRRPSKEADNA